MFIPDNYYHRAKSVILYKSEGCSKTICINPLIMTHIVDSSWYNLYFAKSRSRYISPVTRRSAKCADSDHPVHAHPGLSSQFIQSAVFTVKELHPPSILYKSIAGRYRPVNYPDGPITVRYRFIKNACWGDMFSHGSARNINEGI